jgi:hypothetical protein
MIADRVSSKRGLFPRARSFQKRSQMPLPHPSRVSEEHDAVHDHGNLAHVIRCLGNHQMTLVHRPYSCGKQLPQREKRLAAMVNVHKNPCCRDWARRFLNVCSTPVKVTTPAGSGLSVLVLADCVTCQELKAKADTCLSSTASPPLSTPNIGENQSIALADNSEDPRVHCRGALLPATAFSSICSEFSGDSGTQRLAYRRARSTFPVEASSTH